MSLIGIHGNAWNNVAVGANAFSPVVDLLDATCVHVFGNTSAASTITVLVSQDSVNFATHTTIAANGDFSLSDLIGSRYLQIKSSAAVVITATIAAK